MNAGYVWWSGSSVSTDYKCTFRQQQAANGDGGALPGSESLVCRRGWPGSRNASGSHPAVNRMEKHHRPLTGRDIRPGSCTKRGAGGFKNTAHVAGGFADLRFGFVLQVWPLRPKERNRASGLRREAQREHQRAESPSGDAAWERGEIWESFDITTWAM